MAMATEYREARAQAVARLKEAEAVERTAFKAYAEHPANYERYDKALSRASDASRAVLRLMPEHSTRVSRLEMVLTLLRSQSAT